jgi:outer membrane lipoprotein-sorting protein
MKKILLASLLLISSLSKATTPEELIAKVKAKLDKVNDYAVDGKMRTNIAFIKAPLARVKLYFKKPNKMKMVKEKGLSILPKGGININSANMLGFTNYQTIDVGEMKVDGVNVRVIKLLPNDENSDVVITTLYIDEANLLIKKTATTTKENGSFEMEMTYGKLADYALPDKLVFSFNVKNYKMPKGVTLDFDTGLSKEEKEKMKNKKGKVEFTYTNYVINKGVDDAIFKN